MFNPMRAKPVTEEEFREALEILSCTPPDAMLKWLRESSELREKGGKVVRTLTAAERGAQIRIHTFEPSDIHPDTCCQCGKFKQWRGHSAALPANMTE